MSAVDESTLSVAALKELSLLRKQLTVQNNIIKTQEIVDSQLQESYISKRAKLTIESAERKKDSLDEELATFKKEIEERRKKYESAIQSALEVIEKESKKKSPNTIRAELAAECLTEKINKLLAGWVVPKTEQKGPSERAFFDASSQKKEDVKEEVYMYKGQKVSKFEYERFTRPAPVQKPVQKPVEEPVEDEESDIDDAQLAKDIEEAKQRQRHTLLQIPKRPVKVIKKSAPSL